MVAGSNPVRPVTFIIGGSMELLAELSNSSFGLRTLKVKYVLRKAARAVVRNRKGEVVLVHARATEYYKIPGGGIEEGETMEQAVRREVLEETGCKVKVGKPIGMIIEYRSNMREIQVNYCFSAMVISDSKRASFTRSEKAERMRVVWAKSIGDAIRLAKSGKRGPKAPYEQKFMACRDLKFLEKARELS